jgi:predicted RNA-binding protein YlxR (DUF448 family)
VALKRLVVDAAHQLKVDKRQTAPGRGAYLCGGGCLKAALHRKAFQRAFRGQQLTLDEATLEEDLQSA